MTILDWHEIELAARALLAGELVAMPTETVYGLAGDASNDMAVATIYAAKARPQFNPLIAHMADIAMAQKYADFSPLAQTLAHAFWPGALTLVLPRKKECGLSLLASAGLETIALRCPDHPIAKALLKTVGRPLVAPSANPSGGISPTTADHVRNAMGDKVVTILDGGPCRIGLESTIVKIINEEVTLLRPGGISREQIETAIGMPVQYVQTTHHGEATKGDANQIEALPIEAPGMMSSHYAPKANVKLNVAQAKEGEAFLGFGPAHSPNIPYNLSPTGDLTEAAANLFSMLHQLDKFCIENGLSTITIAPIPKTGLGEAINDRLTRAAAPKPATKT